MAWRARLTFVVTLVVAYIKPLTLVLDVPFVVTLNQVPYPATSSDVAKIQGVETKRSAGKFWFISAL